MRNTLRKTLSLALALMMVISCIAILPAAADEGSAASGSGTGITENSQGTVLWSATFDEEELTADTLLDTYGTRFIKGTSGTSTNNINIVNGKLKLSAGVDYAVVPEISKSGSTVTWSDQGSNNEDFYNLFSGNYYKDGNLLTSYYFDFDYVHDFNRSYRDKKEYTYTNSDGKTVSYTVFSKGSGESLFTVMSTGGYQWIMKVSQDGYVYTSNGGTYTTATFDPTVTTNDWEHFTVTKTVGGTTEYTKKELSAEEWEAIQQEFADNSGTLTAKLTVGNTVNYASDKIYKLEEGTTYNFRYTFDVDPDTKLVSVKVYVKPKDCDGSAWQQVGGTKTYTAGTSYLRPTDGETTTTTVSCDPCIRIKESYTTIYLDNMGFYTWDAGNCTESSHQFLVGTAATLSSDGKTASSLGVCQKCGNAYKLYGDATTGTEFSTVNSDNYSSYVTTDFGGVGVSADKKMVANNINLRVKNAVSGEPVPDFWFEFDTTFTTLRTATGGNTFVGYMTKAADYEGVMLRYVTKSDIYVRTSSSKTYTEKLMTLEKDVHYVFRFHIQPSVNHFNVYVYTVDESGNETLTASSTNGYISFTTTAADDNAAAQGYPAYRLDAIDSTAFNMTEVKQYTKKISATLDKAEKVIDSAGFTTAPTNLKVQGLKTLNDGTTVFGTYANDASSDVRFKSDNLTTAPTLVSFDFMVDDISADATWSLLTFVASTVENPTTEGHWNYIRAVRLKTATNGDGSYSASIFSALTSDAIEIKEGEWVRITATLDPLQKTAHVYVNNELLVSTPATSAFITTMGIDYSKNTYVRLGDTITSTKFTWNVKNFKIANSDTAGSVAAWNDVSDVIWRSTLSSSLKLTVANQNASFGNFYFGDGSTTTANGYTIFSSNAMTTSRSTLGGTRIDVSVSDSISDDVNHPLQGKKYAITSTFAINSEAKWCKTSSTSETGYVEGNASQVTVFRLSKYSDSNKSILLYDDPNVGFRANTLVGTSETGLALFDASGNKLTAWTTIDEDGVPAKVTTATVVVDEESNTFSVYVDGAVAYYKDSTGKLVKAVDLQMAVWVNSTLQINTANESAAEKNTKYKDIAVQAGKQYVRLFQNSVQVYVKEASISLIKDSDVTLIGTQARGVSNADTTFDLRFVFGVDNLYVNSLDYEVSVQIGDTKYDSTTVSSTEVYSSIVNGDSILRSVDCKEGNYLSVLVISGIEKSAVEGQNVTFTITTNSNTYQVLAQFSGTDVTITYGE